MSTSLTTPAKITTEGRERKIADCTAAHTLIIYDELDAQSIPQIQSAEIYSRLGTNRLGPLLLTLTRADMRAGDFYQTALSVFASL